VNNSHLRQIHVGNDLKQIRDKDEEIMCARELLTLGQNVKREPTSDQIDTFLPTSVLNSVNNVNNIKNINGSTTLKLVANLNNNHKTQRVIVQVPSVKSSSGQFKSHTNVNNVSVIRFPNLDGNVSDVDDSESEDDDEEVTGGVTSNRRSATASKLNNSSSKVVSSSHVILRRNSGPKSTVEGSAASSVPSPIKPCKSWKTNLNENSVSVSGKAKNCAKIRENVLMDPGAEGGPSSRVRSRAESSSDLRPTGNVVRPCKVSLPRISMDSEQVPQTVTSSTTSKWPTSDLQNLQYKKDASLSAAESNLDPSTGQFIGERSQCGANNKVCDNLTDSSSRLSLKPVSVKSEASSETMAGQFNPLQQTSFELSATPSVSVSTPYTIIGNAMTTAVNISSTPAPPVIVLSANSSVVNPSTYSGGSIVLVPQDVKPIVTVPVDRNGQGVVNLPSLQSLDMKPPPAPLDYGEQDPLRGDFEKLEPTIKADGTIEWSCKVCFKVCATEHELAIHKKRHKIDAALICPYCSRSYVDQHRYAVHVRIHTGETPYHCELCGKGFRDDRKMKLHMARHNSGLSHKCHLCPRSFEGPKALEKHLKAHALGRFVAPKVIQRQDGSVAMALPDDPNQQHKKEGSGVVLDEALSVPATERATNYGEDTRSNTPSGPELSSDNVVHKSNHNLESSMLPGVDKMDPLLLLQKRALQYLERDEKQKEIKMDACIKTEDHHHHQQQQHHQPLIEMSQMSQMSAMSASNSPAGDTGVISLSMDDLYQYSVTQPVHTPRR